MKIEDLKKAIRILVKEEVKKAVNEEVSKAMGKVLVEMVKEIKTSAHQPTDIMEEEEQPSKLSIPKTKNPKLNSVLSETAKNFKPLHRTNDNGLAELMGGGFDKIGSNETFDVTVETPKTNMDFIKQVVNTPTTSNVPSVLDGGSEIPDALKKIFKKDFRTLMKRIDEQKTNGGGGFIDRSKIF